MFLILYLSQLVQSLFPSELEVWNKDHTELINHERLF